MNLSKDEKTYDKKKTAGLDRKNNKTKLMLP